MVEDPNSQESYTTKEIDIHYNNPENHVEVIEDIGEINGIDDLERYYTGLALNMLEDSRNYFYFGGVEYEEGVSEYSKEKSEESKENVKSRLSWLSSFEYTPEDIRENTKSFLDRFKEVEDSLNSIEKWTEIVDEWSNFVKRYEDWEGSDKSEEYKEPKKYYEDHVRRLIDENGKKGLRVPRG